MSSDTVFARCLQESILCVHFLCGPRTLSPATGGASFVALCCLVSPAGGEAYAVRDSCCSLSLPDTGCSLSVVGMNEWVEGGGWKCWGRICCVDERLVCGLPVDLD